MRRRYRVEVSEVVDDRTMREVLGFSLDLQKIPALAAAGTSERAAYRYRRAMTGFVWEAAALEGNPYTFVEVKTLLDGVTVGGRSVSDTQQVLALAAAARLLDDLVQTHSFALTLDVSNELHHATAQDEAIDAGCVRGTGKARSLDDRAHVEYGPGKVWNAPVAGPGGSHLLRLWDQGVRYIEGTLEDAGQQALTYFLFAILNQFYFDGNKRTARWMMNGHLMSHGLDAIAVPQEEFLRWNQALAGFFDTQDGTEVAHLLVSYQLQRIARESHPVRLPGTVARKGQPGWKP